jgi:heterodisulfide reductase subunit C
MSTLNPNFKKEIAGPPDGSELQNCYLCGTCTAGCPVAELDPDYSPRTIMRLSLLGEEDLLGSGEIWKCSQCSKCTAHCPQNARPSDVIKAVRALAVVRGAFEREQADKLAKIEDEIGSLRLEKIAAVLQEAK